MAGLLTTSLSQGLLVGLLPGRRVRGEQDAEAPLTGEHSLCLVSQCCVANGFAELRCPLSRGLMGPPDSRGNWEWRPHPLIFALSVFLSPA